MNYSYYKKYFIIIFLFVFWLLLPTNKTLAETSCQENTDCPDSCQCIYTNLVSATGNCMSSINTSTPCSEATISTDTNIDAKIADAANYNCKWTEVVTKSGDSYNPVGGCSSDQKNITINDASYYCSDTRPISKYSTYSTDYTCCCTPKNPEIIKTPDLNPLGNLQIKIPGIDELAAKYPVVCTTTSEVESCKIPWIAIYIYAIYNYLLAIGGVLAVIALMIGGIIWLVSAGNASRITQAKSWISGSLTGVLILLTSYILLYQINPDLIGLKYTVLETIDPFELPVEDQVEAPEAGPSSHGVPTFFQCSPTGKKISYDTPTQKCEGKTLCSSGCGIVSTFMAVNKYVSVSDLQEFTKRGISSGARKQCNNGSYASGLIELAKSYGLKSGYLSGKEDIIKKLDNDCVVIISVSGNTGSSCKYTNGGHFIVLTGWRDKSKEIVDVNDPAGRLNSLWVNGQNTFRGECAKYTNDKTGNGTAPCKNWLSLSNWGGCTLNQTIYVCNK